MRALFFIATTGLSILAAAPGAATKGARFGAVTQAPAGHAALVLHPGESAASESRKTTHLPLGRSVGSPTDGHLVGGAHLAEAPYLRVAPVYAQSDVRWGLGPLVEMIDRSARAVRKQFPDAVLSLGHISRAGGGELDRHASHESGRDADIGFYIKNQASHPIVGDHFVAFRGDGTAPSWPGAQFDDARNWSLVSVMVSDSAVRISHIFVATPLRARLLAYAERTGASPAIRAKAAELMMQPHGSLPHDDHFHVRIGCPVGMTGCIENPTAPHRFARVPTPHGRNRSGIVHAPAAVHVAPPALPAPPPALPRKDLERTAPAPDSSPHAEGEPTPDAPPAMMTSPIDDVDGILAPAMP